MSELEPILQQARDGACFAARAKAALHFKEETDDFVAGRTNLYPEGTIEYSAYDEERKLLVVEFMRNYEQEQKDTARTLGEGE